MTDNINHPKHYNNGSGIECLRITEHLKCSPSNACKYLYRHEDKNSPIDDLKKAVNYIENEIDLRINPRPMPDYHKAINHMKPNIGEAFRLLVELDEVPDWLTSLVRAKDLIGIEIAEIEEEKERGSLSL